MAIPDAEQVQSWLVAALRQADERTSGVSLNVRRLAAHEVPRVEVEYTGDPPPPPPTETVGFAIKVCAHRVARDEAKERVLNVCRSIEAALGREPVLPGGAEYEGVGEVSALEEDADRRAFCATFDVYLGFEKDSPA